MVEMVKVRAQLRLAPSLTKGFTLIELIAIITIMGILAAVAGPRFIGQDVFETRGAYGTLLSALRYAQKTAIAQRQTIYVRLDTSARSVCIGYTNNCSSAVIDPATQAAYVKTLSKDVSLNASNTVLGFDALGKPVPNVAATVTIQNVVDTTQGSRTIQIEADTGYVR